MPPLQKVLYADSKDDDCCTDQSFLQSLIVTGNRHTPSFWRVVGDSGAVSQQLSWATATVAFFVCLSQRSVAVWKLGGLCGLMVALWAAFQHLHSLTWSACRQAMLLFTGLYLLSPLLQTLTRSFSSDSITASSLALLLAHLYLHDYNFTSHVTDKLRGSIALSAALSASVLMASRLQAHEDVFAQVSISLVVFLLLPYAQASDGVFHGRPMLSVAGVAALTALLSFKLALLFLLLVGLVSLLGPLLLLRVQKYKARINGPWDEVQPRSAMLTLAKNGRTSASIAL